VNPQDRGGSRAFWLLNLANFGDGIAYFGILNLLTLYLSDEIGFGSRWGHPLVSMFTGCVTLFMLLGGGQLCDRLGARRAITLAQGIQFVGRALLAQAILIPGPPLGRQVVAILALIVMAAGSGLLQPSLYACVKDYTPANKAGMGYSWLYSIMNLGIFMEGMVSPFVRTSGTFIGPIKGLGLGIHGVFWVMAGLSFTLWMANMLFFTTGVEQRERIEHPAVTEVEGAKTGWRASPLADKRFALFIFMLLPVRTLFAHQFLTMEDYIPRCFPHDISNKMEWLQSINPLVIVIGVPLVAWLTVRVPVLRMMQIGTTVSALTTFILVLPPQLDRLVFYMVMFSVGEALWSSRFLEYVAKLAPPGKIGSYMAVANLPWFVAKTTTGLYSGILMEHFIPIHGPQRPGSLWLIYGCIACLTPVGLLLLGKWLMPRPLPETV
jgi:POT family proton-dependent oligopeptide transporter